MARRENAQTITQRLLVSAEGLLTQTADLTGYPYHHIGVVGTSVRDLGRLLAAVDMLSRWGWELVSVTSFGESAIPYAFMRRTTSSAVP